MNLQEEILKEHSRSQCKNIVDWVGDSQKRFDELFGIFIQEESKLTQRVAWPLSYCVEAQPLFMQNKFGKLIKKISTPALHDAVKRNGIRLLQYVSIPEKYQGDIMNLCFTFLESPKETVAVKAFSINVLVTLAKQYPEIAHEIKLLVDEQLPDQTAGFKSSAKKAMKELNL